MCMLFISLILFGGGLENRKGRGYAVLVLCRAHVIAVSCRLHDWDNDGTLPLSEAWPAWDASQLASAEARSKQVDVFGEEGAQSEYKMPQETARGGGLQGLDYPGVIALQGDAAAYTMGGMGLLRAEPFLKQGAAFYIINRQQVPCPRHLHADGWSSKHGPFVVQSQFFVPPTSPQFMLCLSHAARDAPSIFPPLYSNHSIQFII